MEITDEAIAKIAHFAADMNQNVENIGARRLHTIMEKVLEDISFNAPDKNGQTETVDEAYVDKMLADFNTDTNLEKFIL